MCMNTQTQNILQTIQLHILHQNYEFRRITPACHKSVIFLLQVKTSGINQIIKKVLPHSHSETYCDDDNCNAAMENQDVRNS